MSPITYTSEQPKDWALLLGAVEDLHGLRELCDQWKEIAPDALRIANKMKSHEFTEFKAGLKKEQRGIFAGEEWAKKYSEITMPAIMFQVSIKAVQYHVSWGLVYLRMKETGTLPKDEGATP